MLAEEAIRLLTEALVVLKSGNGPPALILQIEALLAELRKRGAS